MIGFCFASGSYWFDEVDVGRLRLLTRTFRIEMTVKSAQVDCHDGTRKNKTGDQGEAKRSHAGAEPLNHSQPADSSVVLFGFRLDRWVVRWPSEDGRLRRLLSTRWCSRASPSSSVEEKRMLRVRTKTVSRVRRLAALFTRLSEEDTRLSRLDTMFLSVRSWSHSHPPSSFDSEWLARDTTRGAQAL